MKFVNSTDQMPKTEMSQTKYDKKGEITNGGTFYAETILTDKMNYFVKTYGSTLYDPYGPYSKRENVLDTKMKRVSQKVFQNYITYLNTRNLKYLTLAERGFIDDRG